MYSNVLLIHNWLRWLTLIACVGGIVYAMRPAGPQKPEADSFDLPGKGWDSYLMLAVDLQMLTGLILYFGLSDFTKSAMENPGMAWQEPSVRYWAILHAGAMFASLLTVRVARVLALNAPTAEVAQKRRLLWFLISTAVILVAVPWPFLSNGRPLFRF